ncbi:MAG: GvpL/GvpF family gas vesicle protein [Oscillochloris sp.]|nr:GvpL/GvpF family gas vesicle protein [Oscillochloris sp.]
MREVRQLVQDLAAEVSEAELWALAAEARMLALADLREQLRAEIRAALLARLQQPEQPEPVYSPVQSEPDALPESDAAVILVDPLADAAAELAALQAQLTANRAWLNGATAIADEPEPAPPPAAVIPTDATALYVYAILPAGRSLAPLEGISGHAVEGLACGAFTLAVSDVPLAEFKPDVLEERVADAAWLEPAVRAHHAVQAALLRDGPLVPLRFATIFSNPERAAAMLTERRESIEAALQRVTDREEWSAKLWLDGSIMAERVAAGPALAELRDRISAGPPGAAYMLQKKLDRVVAAESERLVDHAIDDVHRRLAELAAYAAHGPLRDQQPGEAQVLLNGAYLLDRTALDRFVAEAESLRNVYAPLGLQLELSGPWPPYSFVDSAE